MMLVAMLCALAAGLVNPAGQVEVSVDRDQVSVLRGERFTVASRITNRGAEPTPPLKAHLNVASLTGAVSVDPSDWSDSPVQDLPALAPGASKLISWQLKAGDIGTFALYVALLPDQPRPTTVTSSGPAFVEASGRDTLASAEALPVVVAIPVLLGAAAGLARWRFRRSPRSA